MEPKPKAVKVRKARAIPRRTRDEFVWEENANGFILRLPNKQYAKLIKFDNWKIDAILNNKAFKGERPTLEEAFRALDKVIHRETDGIWTKINPRVIIREFSGDFYFVNQ